MTKLRWGAIALVSVAFALAGTAKLAGVEQMHLSFATLGLPDWFGNFIGAAELAGAMGLWVGKLNRYAALGLLMIMPGAIYFHVMHDVIANAMPAVVLSGLLIAILVLSNKEARLSAVEV